MPVIKKCGRYLKWLGPFIILFAFSQIGLRFSQPDLELDSLNENEPLYISDREAEGGFHCAGIIMLDQGAAMDVPTDFVDKKTKRIICRWSFGGTVILDPSIDRCPPRAWKENACDEEVTRVRRLLRERRDAQQP